MTPQGAQRRVIPQRDAALSRRIAAATARLGLSPNHVSVLSVLISLLGAAGIILGGHRTGPASAAAYIGAAVCIPVRLLCNMLDGMLAVELGRRSPTGGIFNELPDRIADVLLIAAAGYAIAGTWVANPAGDPLDLGVGLGWIAAVLALLTAYVRTLGDALGVGNFFSGPTPKPTRMWILTLACLASGITAAAGLSLPGILLAALGLIAAGSLITVVTRLRHIARALRTAESA